MKEKRNIPVRILIKFRKNWKICFGFSVAFLFLFIFCLPRPLFKVPTSIVLEDREGQLLGASIAKDGQWRFPYSEDIPDKYEKCIIEFEDRRFHSHFGIDPIGIFRAIRQNIENKKVVSGGSTLTMQVIRMARGQRKRNVFNKIIEAFMALRLESTYSKHQVLSLHSSNAPFGGNVVGLDAASWRYYGKKPALLSWGEAATLAVLPNSPALIHPGRNRDALFAKRNRLLDRLMNTGVIDSLSCELAKEEPLPEKPHPLPRLAPHLLNKAASEYGKHKENRLSKIKTTIHPTYQKQAIKVLERHRDRLSANGIHNACVLILDVESGDVLSYVGNMPGTIKKHAPDVDIIKAPRSTGSILKPILFAAMINEGQITPYSLIPDIPTQMGNYRPLNYLETYDGAVSTRRALIRSLNVPFIRMLQKYSIVKFHHLLKKLGMNTLYKSANHYGLTLILGGAEGSLWDITNMYATMARINNHFYDFNGRYDPNDIRNPNYIYGNTYQKPKNTRLQDNPPILSASAIWQTFHTIQHLERPSSEGNWEDFGSESRIAWKTGTSFGFRDAWAIGVNPKYAVGVWSGNADGEGRPGLVGIHASAPILFDIFDFLPSSDWFDKPEDEHSEIGICHHSGYLALPHCEIKDTLRLPLKSMNISSCPYHKIIQIDQEGNRVNALCQPPHTIRQISYFILPPLLEHYYKSKHPSYKALPPMREDCKDNFSNNSKSPMQFIYPKYEAKIYIPVDWKGKESKSIFKATHRDSKAKLYWHLNNDFIGMTETFHELKVAPDTGPHILTIVDENGNSISRKFEILKK